MFLESQTKEEVSLLAETYSKFNLKQIANLDKQICLASNKRLNFGLVLLGLIEQANKYELHNDSYKLTKVKNIYELFIKTLIKKK